MKTSRLWTRFWMRSTNFCWLIPRGACGQLEKNLAVCVLYSGPREKLRFVGWAKGRKQIEIRLSDCASCCPRLGYFDLKLGMVGTHIGVNRAGHSIEFPRLIEILSNRGSGAGSRASILVWRSRQHGRVDRKKRKKRGKKLVNSEKWIANKWIWYMSTSTFPDNFPVTPNCVPTEMVTHYGFYLSFHLPIDTPTRRSTRFCFDSISTLKMDPSKISIIGIRGKLWLLHNPLARPFGILRESD